MAAELLEKFAAISGPRHVKTGADLAALDHGIHADNLKALALVSPADADETAAIVKLCAAARVAIVPQGGRTGLAGGAVPSPDAVIISTQRMTAIAPLEEGADSISVGAGATLAAVQRAAGERDLTPGIDIGARDSCTIGGMIATNAGGSEAFRFGTMRHRLLGLEAVLADGNIVSDLKRVVKANEGYDWKQLMAGSEGTLGIVTRAVLKLSHATGNRVTALAALPDYASALAVFHRLQASPGFTLCTAEIMAGDYARLAAPPHLKDFMLGPLFIVFEAGGTQESAVRAAFSDALAAGMENGLITDCLVAHTERERAEMWKMREDSWVVDRYFPSGVWYDITVPPPALDAYTQGLAARLAAAHPALRIFTIGHLGDGNLHLTICGDAPAGHLYEAVGAIVYDGLAAVGGSFSAEHGIGTEKRGTLLKGDPARLAIMRAIKQALDPQGILNPGKVI